MFNEIQDLLLGLESICEDISRVENLKYTISSNGVLERSIAFESEDILGNSNLVNTYFSGESITQKVSIAMETVSAGMIAAIVAGFTAIAALVYKLVRYLTGNSSGGLKTGSGGSSSGAMTEAQAKAVTAVIESPEVKEVEHTIDDLVEKFNSGRKYNKKRTATEDFSMADNANTETVETLFTGFKESLSSEEIDFLTSSQYHRHVRDFIHDVASSNLSDYIKNATKEITVWIHDGIQDAKNVGKDEDFVNKFKFIQKTKLSDITAKYAHKVERIEFIEEKYLVNTPKGDEQRLSTFLKTPSKVFPLLKGIWADIHVGRLTASDKSMISDLNELQKEFEALGKQMKPLAAEGERIWPPEEAMLELAHKGHRELLNNVVRLVKLSASIHRTIRSAYTATTKTFKYILDVLSLINKMGDVDRTRLVAAISGIRDKQKELADICKEF